MRSAIVPIITTIAGIALEIGNYDNRPLANYLWMACGMLWFLWLLSYAPWFQKTPEERAFQINLEHYRQLSLLIAEGETALVKVRLDEYKAGPVLNRWMAQCHKFLNREYSSEAAEYFANRIINKSVGNRALTIADNIKIRIDYLKQQRHLLFPKL